jgi:ADP-L-glycero-D-manno-heptose 6-epimerase
MASMPYRVWRSIRDHGIIELYEEPEEQPFRRDFVHVDDVVAVLLHFGLDDDKEGPCRTFDVGTGDPRTFGDMAMLVDGHVPPRWPAECRRIPFPAALVGKYQTLTWADLGPLRAAGYSQPFLSLEEGLARSVPQWEQGL